MKLFGRRSAARLLSLAGSAIALAVAAAPAPVPAVAPQPVDPVAAVDVAPGAAATESVANGKGEPRLRKLHLVRPDLIPYPIAFEVYC